MSATPEDFLQFAKRLLAQPNSTEIDFRSAISRAYYSSFHLAETLSKHLPAKHSLPATTHERCISMFLKHPELPFKSVGYLLDKLKKKRHLADYELHANLQIEDAEEAIQTATKINDKVNQFKKTLEIP